MHKLEQPPRRRFFLVGATGSKKSEVARELADRFRIERIHVGDVLKAEINRNTSAGQTIDACIKSGTYIPD